jgi:hypothetical protein
VIDGRRYREEGRRVVVAAPGIGRLRGASRKQKIAVLIGVSAAQGGKER